MTRLRADILLLLVALIWGTAFIAQKHANVSMGPVTFVGARFLLSWLVLFPFAFYEHKRQQTMALKRGDLLIAGAIGLCLFSGASLQQMGLVTTSATHGGFLTALYVVFVPCVDWVLTRKQPRLIVVIACLISIAGAWLLAGRNQAQGGIESSSGNLLGDVLVIIADIAWAIGISLVPVFLKRTHRPFFLSFAQYGIAALLGLLVGLSVESSTKAGVMLAMPSILYAGLLSGGVAYTLQIFAQKHTPAPEAALIMSLESVFAALAGAALLHERLTFLAILGCALIFSGIILVEVGPILRNIRIPLKPLHSKGKTKTKKF